MRNGMGGDQTAGLDQFKALIGVWTVESRKCSQERGRMIVEQIEGGGFLRVRDDMFFATTWIIGSDDSAADCWCLYHDARGIRRIYRTSVADRVWKIWRDHVSPSDSSATSPPTVKRSPPSGSPQPMPRNGKQISI